MVVFKSIVVLDTETTGMPNIEHNCTRIIEIACLGCEIDHIKGTKEFPRVLHKLVVCFHPSKTILPGATATSGLSNELLDNLSPFQKEDVDMMVRFINRLPQPVCLVAHNGLGFDFPILRRMIVKQNCSFPNNIYCADSLMAFRELYPKPTISSSQTSVNNSKGILESTPKSNKTVPINSLNYKSGNSYKNSSPAFFDVSRNLFPDAFDLKISGDFSQNTNIPHPERHTLKHIYYFLHGKNFPNAHRAEDDSKALLSCIIKTDGFFNWMNKNAVVFNSIEPLF